MKFKDPSRQDDAFHAPRMKPDMSGDSMKRPGMNQGGMSKRVSPGANGRRGQDLQKNASVPVTPEVKPKHAAMATDTPFGTDNNGFIKMGRTAKSPYKASMNTDRKLFHDDF